MIARIRRLILVRHGQYDSDTGKLTPLGRRQAATVATALRGSDIGAFHCSSLTRARETAAILHKALRDGLSGEADVLARAGSAPTVCATKWRLKRGCSRPFQTLDMAQQVTREIDERLNELCDRDAFWGPLISFRPEKNRCIGLSRAFLLTALVGVFYGMLLNVILALLCHRGHQMPPVYGAPVVLTITYFVAFQLSIGPAWNRRARLLVRRAGYMDSIGRAR